MKKYKKLLSLICACVLFCNMLTVVGTAAGEGTASNPYIITTAEQLQNINNNVTAHYKLGANINLADMDFTPIGNADSGAFSGSFDGNGYKISNLNVFSGKYAGLFGSNEGTIKNVTLEDIYVYGTRYVGGVVGQNTSCGTLENCSVLSGLVESEGGLYNVNIGGICGINEGAFNGSFSNGSDIDASASDVKTYVGGVCGYWKSSFTENLDNIHNAGDVSSSSSYSYSSSGGLVGYATDITISNSYNTGNISSSSYSGGLIGEAYSTVTISNSYNTGNISSSSSSSSSSSRSGGLIGYASNTTVTISNSYNTGNISSSSSYSSAYANSYSGGLIGYTYSTTVTISNSYNTGNISSSSSYSYSGGIGAYFDRPSTISNCYNIGNIKGYRAGGIAGYSPYNDYLTITSCYTLNSVCYIMDNGGYSHYNGNTISSDNMKKQTSYYGWDFDETWTFNSSINNGYPILKACVPSLYLNISNKNMVVGSKLQLTAYKNGVETRDVTWSVSSDSAIITSNGLATACTDGSLVTITATDSDGNKANFNTYIFTPATSLDASDITISTTAGSVEGSDYFVVRGSSTDVITCFESNDTSVLKVSGIYLIPLKAGVAKVTVTTASGLSLTKTVTVTDVAKGISLPSSLTISRGSTAKITATVSPNPTTSTITWKSSDPTVATVDSNGNVTGLKIGSTTITATTDNGLSSNCVVTVSAPLTEMAFVTPALTLFKGETYKLKLNIAPTDTTDTITYSSSSSSRATVSSTGVVTVGTSTGTVTITATSSNGMKATCTITVENWPDVLVAVDSATTISGRTILTDIENTTRITNLVNVKEGYTLRATPSSTVNGFNYYGTGATVDVLDDYGNVVITYTVAVNGDLNGDSFCDVLDAMLAQRYSTYVDVPTDAQVCAAAGSTDASEIDVEAYQNVVNQVVS